MDRPPPFLTIVIPTYNRADSVARAVGSCLTQTDPDLRVIVVVDGATDATTAMLAAINDARLTVIEQANQGVSAARNTGMAAATTAWIAFLDDDDTFEPGYVAAVRALLAEHGDALDVFWCGVNRLHVDASGNTAERPGKAYPARLDRKLDFVTRFASSHGFGGRREQLRAVGGFDVALRQSEDIDLLLRLLAAGARCQIVTAPLVNLHIHGGPSLSRSNNHARAIAAHERLIARNRDFLDAHPRLLWHYFYVLAGDYYRQGDRANARRCLKQMWRLRPGHPAALQRWLKFEWIRRLRPRR